MNWLKEYLFGVADTKEKKSKNNKWMLLGYGIFILIVIIAIRSAPVVEKSGKDIVDESTNTKTEETQKNENKEVKEPIMKKENYDVNYSYSYVITFDGETETYLGKKVDDKEKFSYVKNDQILEYAILNDNYLLLENGVYHITDTLNTYFKYCDVDKLLPIFEENDYVIEENNYIYDVTNAKLASVNGEILALDNGLLNRIVLVINGDNLKSVSMDLTNYISSILGSNHTLNIKMDFVDVGTTDNFEIKIN